MKTPIAGLADFAALDPFFRIIEEGLQGLVGPGHFFDLLAEDVVFEYIITVPGYPRRVDGRAAVAELYRPYGDALALDRCYDLTTYHDAAQGTVILEFTILPDGTAKRGVIRRIHHHHGLDPATLQEIHW